MKILQTLITGYDKDNCKLVSARSSHRADDLFDSDTKIKEYLSGPYADFLRPGWQVSDYDIAQIAEREYLDRVASCERFETETKEKPCKNC